jgi:hypothetical protein
VTVGRFTDATAAQAPRIRLEAEGIPTFLEGERMGSRSMYSIAIGGARLKVPEDLASDARVLLSQTWSATAAALDIDDWDDDDVEDLEKPVDEPSSLRTGLWIFLIVVLPALVSLVMLLSQWASQP